jgi:hypothetical protein
MNYSERLRLDAPVGRATRARISRLTKHAFFNAPWAFIASLSHGLSNYLIMLLLGHYYGLAASGQFRLLTAIVGTLSIFTLVDSGKVVVKYLIMGRTGVVRPILMQRIRWGLLGAVGGVITSAVLYQRGDDLWLPLLVAALLLPLTMSADLYGQINQARSQFRLNALYSVIKYGSLVLIVPLGAVLQLSVQFALVAYSVMRTAFTVLFLAFHPESYEKETAEAKDYRRQSLQLSGSGMFAILLEHADKFLISYFFGMEALGLYAIGVSTGRLLLNVVKPTMTVFFNHFVHHRPSVGMLVVSFLLFTGVGIGVGLLMKYYFEYLLNPIYYAAYPMAAVIVAGLGIYCVQVVMFYSAIYYKGTNMVVPTLVNLIVAVLTVVYLAASIYWGGQYALMLCALSYPLRDALGLIAVPLVSRWFQPCAPS